MGKAEDGVRSQVLARQMDTLYKAAPASVLSIAGAGFALAVYWGPGMRAGLVAWFTIVSFVALFHLATALTRRAGLPQGFSPRHWARTVTGVYLASGSAWGIGGAWMICSGNQYQALFMCCLAMGAVTVTFPSVVYPRVFHLFQAGVLLPIGVGLAFSDVVFGTFLAIAAIMLAACMTAIGHGMGAQLADGLRLSIENEALVRRLEERGTELEAANRELEIQSSTDPLTGVANRRGLMRSLRGLNGRAALLIVDVDHFKQYNDSFGHVEGDACLVLVAMTLRRCARPGVDLVARQGGEEFAIVVADVEEEKARAIAEEICANIRALADTWPKRIRRTVTVSVGMAWRSGKAHKSVAVLMQEADTALYAAKRAGRDRVSVGGETGRSAVA